ncbi:ABC-type sugar transport system, periplasmic component [Hahella chejuensis KCTC 2396]|uniref:Probable sugar-binding periplasmic protein n=1 Tax=Hahella chejuensis (strain KCTC 2396) TaxID=349521 RepID=Q2S9E3_HAHCH|nr:ABC transporter substrate-binding protein [Hahella chejuensis]ABC32731.1 ABC-type sugar transport system, periplasmic component [Hahella chejuensis KCTC 2396]
MKRIKKALAPIVLSGIAAATSAQAGEVEVLHWWTSGGEAASVAVLKGLLEKEGHTWKDFAVAGGGGESAMTVLKSRAVSGNPPAAAQIKGLDIQEWANLGLLANLDSVAKTGNWDKLLPEVVSNVMKYENHYVAVPVNVHRVNWLWANPDVFRKAGVGIPTTWEEFPAAADAIQKAGFIPLAHGGQAWQDATLFEAIALGMGGSEFYNKAFVKHDADTLKSEKMVKIFETFKSMRKYIDKDAAGRDWNIATSMVINGKAAMQVMGDWAKGEFTAAGKKPGVDYMCLPAPGTSGQFTFNIDSFAMFKLNSDANVKAQDAMARLIMEPTFQETFNLNKGSIPVRSGMARDKFDSCAEASMDAFNAAASTGDLVPSMAHGMSTTSYIQGAIYDVVTNFFNDDSQSAKEAVNKLAQAVKAAM